jgi:hypothetical protein
MKDNNLYLVRVTYKEAILSGYFVGIKEVNKEIKHILKTQNREDIEKIEYGIAPRRSKWRNWFEDTVKEVKLD